MISRQELQEKEDTLMVKSTHKVVRKYQPLARTTDRAAIAATCMVGLESNPAITVDTLWTPPLKRTARH